MYVHVWNINHHHHHANCPLAYLILHVHACMYTCTYIIHIPYWHVIRHTSLIGAYYLLSAHFVVALIVLYYAHWLLIGHVLGHMAKLQLLTLAFRQHIARNMSSCCQMTLGNGFAAISRPAASTKHANRSTCKVFVIRCFSRLSAYFHHVEI